MLKIRCLRMREEQRLFPIKFDSKLLMPAVERIFKKSLTHKDKQKRQKECRLYVMITYRPIPVNLHQFRAGET